MQLSLSFIVFLFLIVFPGLIYRRLYFYGEFSKQYRAEFDLINLIALSIVPGLLNFILIFYLYNNYIEKINIDIIIDLFNILKNIGTTTITPKKPFSFNQVLNKNSISFIFFLYFTVSLLGLLSGRLIRVLNLDTKFKLLRFKNYWFYLFNGEHTKFKKMKHLKSKNKKHLFTEVDVQIETNGTGVLYSGIIVDYELSDKNSCKLDKIILQNAKRYSKKEKTTERVKIPGDIFVLDCASMKNINFTYVYKANQEITFLNSRTPDYIYLINGFLIIFLIPLSIFKIKYIDLEIYNTYFTYKWYVKILTFFFLLQVISVFNPFKIKEDNYEFESIKTVLGKILWIIVLSVFIWKLK